MAPTSISDTPSHLNLNSPQKAEQHGEVSDENEKIQSIDAKAQTSGKVSSSQDAILANHTQHVTKLEDSSHDPLNKKSSESDMRSREETLPLSSADTVALDDDGVDFKEDLAGLFLWWYGNNRSTKIALSPKWQQETRTHLSGESLPSMSVSNLESAWRKRWFAKEELTVPVDKEMQNRFAPLLEKVSQHDISALTKDAPIWERMAYILLFDQVPRNIFRGNPQAYQYDQHALPLAKAIINDTDQMKRLPLHFQATLLICICHSENKADQQLIKDWIEGDHFSQFTKGSTEAIAKALTTIVGKHMDRINLFGRFPERNDVLGRKSTPEESALINALQ